MIFVNDINSSNKTWFNSSFMIVSNILVIHEKLYIIIDNFNNYSIVVSSFKQNNQDFNRNSNSILEIAFTIISIKNFYIAQIINDKIQILNLALQCKRYLFLIFDVYNLFQLIVIHNFNIVSLKLNWSRWYSLKTH